MNIQKIYAGWVINVNGEELKIIGSHTIRKNTTYIVKDQQGNKSGIKRDTMIEGFKDGRIQYIRSEAI